MRGYDDSAEVLNQLRQCIEVGCVIPVSPAKSRNLLGIEEANEEHNQQVRIDEQTTLSIPVDQPINVPVITGN